MFDHHLSIIFPRFSQGNGARVGKFRFCQSHLSEPFFHFSIQKTLGGDSSTIHIPLNSVAEKDKREQLSFEVPELVGMRRWNFMGALWGSGNSKNGSKHINVH
jgi:hypothetical protein